MAKDKNSKEILMTQEGLQELKEELRILDKEKRPKAVERLKAARELGDLKENSEYSSARLDLDYIDERIAELKEKLRRAKVVLRNKSRKTINIGSKVTLETNKKKVNYTIVGEEEADPREKKISHLSPLGEAILGKRVGDKVQVDAPAGKIRYNIKEIK
jgi:transcription elongation factor GreA